MNLLKEIQQKLGLAYLLIAHDLAVVYQMSTTSGVMYLGKLVEVASSEELFANILHPYTAALFSAALPSHPREQRNAIELKGEVPTPIDPPSGCRFHARCPHSMAKCLEAEPALIEVAPHHWAACHLNQK
jgi:oligopeptide/dipeptide ABC transporter ATP-binding protein